MSELLATDNELAPEEYPRLWNSSPAFFFRALPTQRHIDAPEYIHVPVPDTTDRLEVLMTITEWNMCWEVGTLRPEMFEDRLPPALSRLRPVLERCAESNVNIALVPDTGTVRYHAYAPLYHLLPRRILTRFGLPLLKKGVWPYMINFGSLEELLPSDLNGRLARAVGAHLWPLLDPRTPASAFSSDDPIKLIAHDLDFWRTYLDQIVQETLRGFPRLDVEDEAEQRWLDEASEAHSPDISIAKPLKGGDIWVGEEEAWEVSRRLIDIADERGRIRALLDAVRSNRVEDDFSSRWSWAKEDLERRLYHKRNKIKVSFVELDDTIPVHGPEVQVDAEIVLGKLFALCDTRERRVLVCMRSGETRVGEIASALGYANHSPVSKILKGLREKAARLLDLE